MRRGVEVRIGCYFRGKAVIYLNKETIYVINRYLKIITRIQQFSGRLYLSIDMGNRFFLFSFALILFLAAIN